MEVFDAVHFSKEAVAVFGLSVPMMQLPVFGGCMFKLPIEPMQPLHLITRVTATDAFGKKRVKIMHKVWHLHTLDLS